jgi:hypothetical protein
MSRNVCTREIYSHASLILEKNNNIKPYEITLLSVCLYILPPQLVKARIVEPEDTAVTASYTRDMMPENWSSAVREVPQKEPLLGNSLVIRSSNSQGCFLYI